MTCLVEMCDRFQPFGGGGGFDRFGRCVTDLV